MPSQPFFPLSRLDNAPINADSDAIDAVNPQRFEFKQLDGVYFVDHEAGEMAGYRDVRPDEFWVRGHVPGRPLFPGVLMIETAAQLVSYYAMTGLPDKGFLGFGGADDVKFRGEVKPGDRIILVGVMTEMRRRRCKGAVQGYVDGRLIFEGTICGVWM